VDIEMNNEPVAWVYRIKNTNNNWELNWKKPMTDELFDSIPLYTHPVKELTDEEITEIVADKYEKGHGRYIDTDLFFIEFARAILRKAQEK
jgi:hypothetical protein